MSKKRGLGKGLSALIKDETIYSDERLAYIDVELLTPNPFQPRKDFDEESLEELSNSIKKQGIIQPIVVSKRGTEFQIIVGERRWRAAKKAGLKKIPAIVKKVTEKELLEFALLENIHREDLNPIEKAESLYHMNTQLGLTHEDIANILSIDRSTVTNLIRLLKLPDFAKEALRKGEIKESHAEVLLSIKDETLLKELIELIKRRKLSVRELERIAKSGKRGKRKIKKDLYLKSLEEELSSVVGTKVKFKPKKRGGVLEIHYKTNDQLESLIKLLKGE